MDNHNQVVKICGICGNKQVYSEYHRLFNQREACVAKNSAPDFQVIRGEIIARSILYRKHKKCTKIPYTANRRA